MSKRKFKAISSFKLGAKSVSHSDIINCYIHGPTMPYDPYVVEHSDHISPGCSQCHLVIHSRRMCNSKYCSNTSCCSTTISVHCRSSGYDASVTFPFSVKIDVQFCTIRIKCRYCNKIIRETNVLDSFVENKTIIDENIKRHQKKDEVVLAVACGTTRKFGTKSPIQMLDPFTIKKIFSLV